MSMFIYFLFSLLCQAAAPPDPMAVMSMIPGFPGIWEMMQRQPTGGDQEMERLTLAPIIKMNLTKTILKEPIVPDIEQDLDKIISKPIRTTTATPKSKNIMKKVSFLQANPFYLRNSGDVTLPLRRPPQAYVNIAVRENVAGSQGAKLIFKEKEETEKLRKKNNELLLKMLLKANMTSYTI